MLELQLSVAGPREALLENGGVDAAHITEVFQETLAAADGPSYTVSVVLGEAVPLIPERRRARALRLQSQRQWQPQDKAKMADARVVPGFEETTLGPLFEQGGTLRAASCMTPLKEQVRLPILFYVQGPRLTITSAEGIRIIQAFSAVRFASLLGAEVATAVCGATLQSVVQVTTTTTNPSPPAEAQDMSGEEEAPAVVETTVHAPAAAAPSQGQAAASPNAVGAEEEHGRVQVSAATRAALITAGVLGTIVILVGAVRYALAVRPSGAGGSAGAMVVYADRGVSAYLHP